MKQPILFGGVAVVVAAIAGIILMGTMGTHATNHAPIQIGAIYPLRSGPPAVQEYEGFRTAVQMVNAHGGVRGHRVTILIKKVLNGDQAPDAVSELVNHRVPVIVGSESSLVGLPASEAAQAAHTIYLEGGAVATMLTMKGQPDVFRTVTTGQTLGRSAANFAASVIAPRLHLSAHRLRVAVVGIQDVYGNSVAAAQIAETHKLGMKLVGVFRYQMPGANFVPLVAALKRSRPNIVLVAAYIPDALAFRRETLRQHLRVAAMIGTSSSFCMPAFGKTLGWKAVGLFAADKPDFSINPAALDPAARRLRSQVEALYARNYRMSMTGPAIAGFVGGWVLLHDVLPHARTLTTGAIRRAFLSVNLPYRSEINGAGVFFARPSASDAGQNLRATSVIWQWQRPGKATIVCPSQFARGSVRFVPLPQHP